MFCEAFHYVNSCLTTPDWSDVLQTEPRKKLTHKQNWPCIA